MDRVAITLRRSPKGHIFCGVSAASYSLGRPNCIERQLASVASPLCLGSITSETLGGYDYLHNSLIKPDHATTARRIFNSTLNYLADLRRLLFGGDPSLAVQTPITSSGIAPQSGRRPRFPRSIARVGVLRRTARP